MNPPVPATRVMIYTAAVLFVVGLAWLLVQIKSILIILVLGIIVGAAIEPFVQRLRRVGLSRGQAIMAVYLALFVVISATIYLIVPPLTRQMIALVNDIPVILDDFERQARASNNDFVRTNGVRSLVRAQLAYEEFRADPPIESSTAIGYVMTVLGGLFTAFSVLIVAFYWTTEKATIKRVILGLFPLDKRDGAHEAWDEIEAKLGGWTRGQIILCSVIGVLSGVAYWAIGLEFWVALAIFAGITELIPFIGPILGGAAAFTIALTDSWQKALIVVLIVVILQQVEGAVLVPRVMRNAVGLTPLSVILAVFIGGALLGPLGAIIGIPVAAAVQVLVQTVIATQADDPDTGETGEAIAQALTGRAPPAPDGAAPEERQVTSAHRIRR